MLLIEHKSAGQALHRTFRQSVDWCPARRRSILAGAAATEACASAPNSRNIPFEWRLRTWFDACQPY
jgi:hypothetical protein